MDEALKQRLVGASVLVVLAVIFLPVLLDGSGMQKAPSQLNIELPDATPTNTVTITLRPDPVPKPVVEPQKTPVTKSQETSKPVVETATEPETQPEPVAEPKPVVTQPVKVIKAEPAPTGQQWVIQIGSFSQQTNAQALRDKLINNGYKSFVEASGSGSKKVFRVRVGPVFNRDEAEKIRERLKVQEQRSGLVMAYP